MATMIYETDDGEKIECSNLQMMFTLDEFLPASLNGLNVEAEQRGLPKSESVVEALMRLAAVR